MADDEETPTEVVVADEVVEAPDEVTNEGDTTIVVETPPEPAGDAVEAVVIENAIDTATRLAQLEAENEELRRRVAEVEIDATIAQITAEEAVAETEAVVEAANEAIVETLEDVEISDEDNDGDLDIQTDEIEPVSSRVHPLFRSWDDWKAGRK